VKVAANGVELFFDVEGTWLVADGPWMRERPTVVLLPTGPGLDHSLYKAHVGPELARDAQVVYVDLRGSGRSDWSSEEHWTLDTWIDDLVGLYDALELERPLLLGTGIGGTIALLVAARHPERVERLVLVSTVARYSHTRVIAEFDRLGGHDAGEVAARYFADPTEASWAEYMRVCVPLYTRRGIPPDVIARMVMNTEQAANWDRSGERDFDLRQEAPNVRCPTLVLAGADDPGATVAGVEELVAALPPELVRYERFDGVGHGVFRDRPESISLVREFLFDSAAEPA
jgi:pimeloyl-ACP methyl ester carboxylesterase